MSRMVRLLTELGRLRDRGIVTDDVFQAQKAGLLA